MHEDRKINSQIMLTYGQHNRLTPDAPIDPKEVDTDADHDFLRMTHIDWELKELVAACLAYQPAEIPPKAWILAATDDAIANRTWEKTINMAGGDDADSARRMATEVATELSPDPEAQFIQEFIYNADNEGVQNSLLGDVYDIMGPAPRDESLYYQQRNEFMYGIEYE